MKRNILFLLSLCMLLLTCSDGNDPIKEIEKPNVETKDPFITLKKTNIDFINEGGSEAISIESNVSWTAKSSASWCTVSPSSGNKSTASITLSAPANEDYDNRSCTVTITGGSLSKTITVNQGENVGLLVTQDRYELSNEESTIKVEVKANVEFEVEINDKWITKVETRGLSTSQIEFKIAENETYVNRDGSITIKQKGGNLTSTISIFQSQEDALILSEKDFDISSEAQSVEVEVKTNIDYEIIIPEDAKDWVSHATTRALRTETVVLDVAENKEYDERTVEVIVKDKKTDLEETVTIKQAANTGLIISEDKYELTNDGGTIEVEVKANVEFEVVINDAWISKIDTRSLKTSMIEFKIAKNDTYGNREGSITIKQKGGNMSSTIKVYQSQEDAIILSKKNFELSSEAQSIDVEIKTNVDYEIIIPEDAKDWVSHATTRSLRTETVVLDIAQNKDYDVRSAKIVVKDKKTNLQETVTIKQAANTGLIVSTDKYELTNDGGTIEIEVKANVEFDIEIGDSWITRVKTRGLTTTNLSFEVAKNESYSNREGTITISQTDGDLSSTITVYQSQENAIILSEKDVEVSDRSQTLNVVIKTNIDFDITIQEKGKSWVSYMPTRGLRDETISLNISANNSAKVRSTEVYIKDKITSLQETLIINQIGKEPGVYYVERMGTLSSMLSQAQKDTITTMTIKGEINKADFDVMKSQMPKLKHIDLKEVKCEGDKIPELAFGGYQDFNDLISTVILPNSITSIEYMAFNNCSGLTGHLEFPEGLKKIGSSAFHACYGLTGSLIIPEGITKIENSAFAGCSGFTSLTLPKGLTLIDFQGFNGCSGFTGSLNLPKGLLTIEARAFIGCRGFTGPLILPEGLKKIGGTKGHEDGAFEGCSNFTGSLILPESLEYIGRDTFSGCSGFTGELNLPMNLTTIESNAFARCTGFNGELSLPDGIKKIGGYAFFNCEGFTGELILPEGLNKIEAYTFFRCNFTGTLTLPDNITSVGNNAFYYCNGFTGLIIKSNLVTIYESAFENCANISGKIVFPISLNSIRNNAFNNCRNVEAFQFSNTTPPPYYIDMLPSNATVEVPTSAVDTYKSTNGWKDYNIVGY